MEIKEHLANEDYSSKDLPPTDFTFDEQYLCKHSRSNIPMSYINERKFSRMCPEIVKRRFLNIRVGALTLGTFNCFSLKLAETAS